MYCTQCSTSFDSTKLYVHLRQHKGVSAQDLSLKCIFVLMNRNNIQRLFRAKINPDIIQKKPGLGQNSQLDDPKLTVKNKATQTEIVCTTVTSEHQSLWPATGSTYENGSNWGSSTISIGFRLVH